MVRSNAVRGQLLGRFRALPHNAIRRPLLMVGFVGGNRLKAHLAGLAEKLGDGKVLRVGFLEGETYPDGTNVAQVAFWNEYGTVKSPPRPFFRQMIAAKSPGWGAALAKNLTATDYNTELALK